jgi:autotransporter-associated beta strand protein
VSLGSDSKIVAGSGAIILSNPGSPAGSFGLTIAGGASGSRIDSQINNFTSLTKEGPGDWTLTGASVTFIGPTTINAGKLIIGPVASISGSPVTVNSGGTLAGGSDRNLTAFGQVGSLTVNPGGIVSPGASNGGINVIGDLNLVGSARLNIDITGPGRAKNAMENYDSITVSASVNLGFDAILSITNTTYTAVASDIYFLVNNIGGGTSGRFYTINGVSGSPETFMLNGQRYQISYTANYTSNSYTGGNDVAVGLDSPWSYSGFAQYYSVSANPTDDDDKDGICNLLEYALGTDPTVYNNPAISYGVNGLHENTITYAQRVADGSGMPDLAPTTPLTITGEASSDLINWSPLGPATHDGQSPIRHYTFTDTGYPSTTHGLRFIRLRVTK